MKTRKYGIPKKEDAIDRLYKINVDLLADDYVDVDEVDFDEYDLTEIFDHIERYGVDE